MDTDNTDNCLGLSRSKVLFFNIRSTTCMIINILLIISIIFIIIILIQVGMTNYLDRHKVLEAWDKQKSEVHPKL